MTGESASAVQNRSQEGRMQEGTQGKGAMRCTLLPDRTPPRTEVSSKTRVGYKARKKSGELR